MLILNKAINWINSQTSSIVSQYHKRKTKINKKQKYNDDRFYLFESQAKLLFNRVKSTGNLVGILKIIVLAPKIIILRKLVKVSLLSFSSGDY